jgi:hypothetical protein
MNPVASKRALHAMIFDIDTSFFIAFPDFGFVGSSGTRVTDYHTYVTPFAPLTLILVKLY